MWPGRSRSTRLLKASRLNCSRERQASDHAEARWLELVDVRRRAPRPRPKPATKPATFPLNYVLPSPSLAGTSEWLLSILIRTLPFRVDSEAFPIDATGNPVLLFGQHS
jgi:hypothetical protein